MNDATRRAVAYIVGCLNQKNHNTYVYDNTNNKHYNFMFTGSSVYDYSTSKYLMITRSSNNSYNIYSYLNNNYVMLNFQNNNFNGYDYNSGRHFNGYISGRNIHIYDFEYSKFYNYLT